MSIIKYRYNFFEFPCTESFLAWIRIRIKFQSESGSVTNFSDPGSRFLSKLYGSATLVRFLVVSLTLPCRQLIYRQQMYQVFSLHTVLFR